MTLDSRPTGKVVGLTCYLPITKESIDVATVSFPKVNQYYNRNGYCVKHYHGESLLITISNSYEAIKNVQNALLLMNAFIKESYALPLKILIEQSHQLLQENHYSKGMDMGILRIIPDKIESIVIGNVVIKPLLPDSKIMSQNNGRLGCNIPKALNAIVLKRAEKFSFALHFNGIKHTKLTQYHPLELSSNAHAEKLFDTYAVADEDPTIIVVKSYG